MLNYAEPELAEQAAKLATRLGPEDRVLLEGELGAGKSTFARYLLEALGVTRLFEGSPTFSIAHEYMTRIGPAIHMDFYRLRSFEEIEQAGIPDYFWARSNLVICEWLSNWPEFEKKVIQSRKAKSQIWRVKLSGVESEPSLRQIELKMLS